MQHLIKSATHRYVFKKPNPSETSNIYEINAPGPQLTDLVESSSLIA